MSTRDILRSGAQAGLRRHHNQLHAYSAGFQYVNQVVDPLIDRAVDMVGVPGLPIGAPALARAALSHSGQRGQQVLQAYDSATAQRDAVIARGHNAVSRFAGRQAHNVREGYAAMMQPIGISRAESHRAVDSLGNTLVGGLSFTPFGRAQKIAARQMVRQASRNNNVVHAGRSAVVSGRRAVSQASQRIAASSVGRMYQGAMKIPGRIQARGQQMLRNGYRRATQSGVARQLRTGYVQTRRQINSLRRQAKNTPVGRAVTAGMEYRNNRFGVPSPPGSEAAARHEANENSNAAKGGNSNVAEKGAQRPSNAQNRPGVASDIVGRPVKGNSRNPRNAASNIKQSTPASASTKKGSVANPVASNTKKRASTPQYSTRKSRASNKKSKKSKKSKK